MDLATHAQFFSYFPPRTVSPPENYPGVLTLQEIPTATAYKFVNLKKYYRNLFFSSNQTKKVSVKKPPRSNDSLFGGVSQAELKAGDVTVSNMFPIGSIGSLMVTGYALATLIMTVLFLLYTRFSASSVMVSKDSKDQWTWTCGLWSMISACVLGFILLGLVWWNWNYPSDSSGAQLPFLKIMFTVFTVSGMIGLMVVIPQVKVLMETFPLKPLFTSMAAIVGTILAILMLSYFFFKENATVPTGWNAWKFSSGNIRYWLGIIFTLTLLFFSACCLIILSTGTFYHIKQASTETPAYMVSLLLLGFWWIFPIVHAILHSYLTSCNSEDRANLRTNIYGGVLQAQTQGNEYLRVQPPFGFFTTQYEYQPEQERFRPNFENAFLGGPSTSVASDLKNIARRDAYNAARTAGKTQAEATLYADNVREGTKPGSLMDKKLSDNMYWIFAQGLGQELLMMVPIIIHMVYMIKMKAILKKSTSTKTGPLQSLLQGMIVLDLIVCLVWILTTSRFMFAISESGNLPVCYLCILLVVVYFTYALTIRTS